MNAPSGAKSPVLPTTNAEKTYSEVLASLQVPRDKLRGIATHLYNELVKGLHADGAALKMIPSHVHTLPTGREMGTYLALDLGGTNFRVCAVNLRGEGKLDVVADKYTIPDDAKVGSGDALFDFVAGAVHQFLVAHETDFTFPADGSGELELGFTFSFPVMQTSVAAGSLMHWAKGFDCPDLVGQDVVEALQRALRRRGVRVHVAALVNDTVGTLVAHAYQSPNTVMGVIFGTGTNAAYVEHTSQIPKYIPSPTEKHHHHPQMLINTEWGAFDNEKKVLPLTAIDHALDAASSNPGQQLFEKLISGMYLGEVTRLALLHLIDAGALFGGKLTDELTTPYAFHTAYMSAIEADVTPALSGVAQILTDHFALAAATLTDRQLVKSLVQQIGTRAARLSAVAVFALLEKMSVPRDNEPVVVAMDGSVWLKYPGFQERLRAALRELMGPEKAALVNIETASDGSGAGAGLIAALVVAHKED
ncbi:hexokinase [Blastocladiella emersonii ATCC 22665]|nr:hexokinase [Blastocladiella emersonii ATCC 22665]